MSRIRRVALRNQNLKWLGGSLTLPQLRQTEPSFLQKLSFAVAVSQTDSFRVSGWAHLSPCFAQRIDHGFIGRFARQLSELVFEEYKTKRVFENAGFGILGEVLF